MNNSEKFWDRTATTYDQEEKKDEHTYTKIIEKTIKYLKPNDIILDYGCGTGRVSNEIANHVTAIHAIDTSAKMIEIAKRKVDGRGIENVVYTHSTISDERYESGSFNAVLAFYILHLLEKPHKVLQRFNELLKPGGLIISATPCMGEKKTLQSIFFLAGKIGLVPNIKSFKISELENLIAHASFEIVETECLHQSTREYFIVAKKR